MILALILFPQPRPVPARIIGDRLMEVSNATGPCGKRAPSCIKQGKKKLSKKTSGGPVSVTLQMRYRRNRYEETIAIDNSRRGRLEPRAGTRAAVDHHIAELAALGVPAPLAGPVILSPFGATADAGAGCRISRW